MLKCREIITVKTVTIYKRLYLLLFIYYLLKLYLPLVHKIAFANKFQLYRKIKYDIIYDISLHIKHPQSISPILLISFLNSNNSRKIIPYERTAGRLQQQEDYSI